MLIFTSLQSELISILSTVIFILYLIALPVIAILVLIIYNKNKYDPKKYREYSDAFSRDISSSVGQSEISDLFGRRTEKKRKRELIASFVLVLVSFVTVIGAAMYVTAKTDIVFYFISDMGIFSILLLLIAAFLLLIVTFIAYFIIRIIAILALNVVRGIVRRFASSAKIKKANGKEHK